MIRAIDTNILVRLITGDDPGQAAVARAIVAEDFMIPATVLLETGWVLKSRYGFTPAMVAEALRMAIDLPQAVETPPRALWALERIEHGASLADMIHIAESLGATAFATFDRAIAAQAGEDSPIPIETLG